MSLTGLNSPLDVDLEAERDSRRSVSVVLPAYNEGRSLGGLLEELRSVVAAGRYVYEIVVVDDGSTDDTVEVARSFADVLPLRLILHEVNQGYGAAIRTGLLASIAKADFVVTMDADNSHPAGLIPALVDRAEDGFDLVIASRFQPGGAEVGVPLLRRFLSHGAGFLFRIVSRVGGVRDYTCGFRLYRRHLLRRMIHRYGEKGLVRRSGFACGFELLLKARDNCARVSEVPLVLRYDKKLSTSKMQIRSTIRSYLHMVGTPAGRRSLLTPDAASGRAVASARARRLSPRDAAVLATADTLAVLTAFGVSLVAYAWSISAGWLERSPPDLTFYALLGALFSGIVILSFVRKGLFGRQARGIALVDLQRVIQGVGLASAVFLATLFVFDWRSVSRVVLLGGILLSFPLLLFERRIAATSLRRRQLARGRGQRVVILGAGETGRLLMKKVVQSPGLATNIVGFIDSSLSVGDLVECRTSQTEPLYFRTPVLGGTGQLEEIALRHSVDEILVTDDELDPVRLRQLLDQANNLGIRVGFVPRVGSLRADQLRVEDISALPVLRPDNFEADVVYDFCKRVFDVTGAVAVLVLTAPLWPLTALAIRVDTGAPFLFRQRRIGRRGVEIEILKFRTMQLSADPYSPSPEGDDDPRVTRVGRWLRSTGIDELPQLLNVLSGDLSLVGPRPEMPQIVAGYSRAERERLRVKPGITGLWQLSPDRAQAIHANIEYDLYYCRHRSLSLDLLIVLETVLLTLSSTVRLLWRPIQHAADSVRHAVASRGAQRALAEGTSHLEGAIFVALDQRCRPGEPDSWETWVPPFAEVAATRPVVILVAVRNEKRFRVLANGRSISDDREGSAHRFLEFVEYKEREEMLARIGTSSLVVTDLPFVADYAEQARRTALLVDGSGALLRVANDGSRSWIEELGERLPVIPKVVN